MKKYDITRILDDEIISFVIGVVDDDFGAGAELIMTQDGPSVAWKGPFEYYTTLIVSTPSMGDSDRDLYRYLMGLGGK